MQKYLITTSLAYANGPLHLGHVLEHIQADIWVRFLRKKGHECLFMSGDDAHGSAIMLSAEKQNIDPETYVASIQRQHQRDLEAAGVVFDCYHSTRTAENKALVEDFFQRLNDKGCFIERDITQAYDAHKNMFLPDRYVKGQCPKCGATDQYGDHCESCGATYMPVDLIEPYSVLSQTAIDYRQSKHLFFSLSACQALLQQWLFDAELQSPVRNKLQEWLDKGLIDWDITRDAPYFGFAIPGRDKQYFYVWMDAPIGYLAAVEAYDAQHGTKHREVIWQQDSDWQVVHFIGKDIVNFHGVFWPAVLKQAGFKQPDALHVHGFLTINGEKMSKSRGTFITAERFLEQHSAEYLRYYLAAKLSDQVADIDLNWEDVSNRCNADLVGKFVNIASRCSGFLHKFHQARVQAVVSHPLLDNIAAAQATIDALYYRKSFQAVVREIMALADQVNRYVDEHKPWQLAKNQELEAVQKVCSVALHAFRLLAIYLEPIIPSTVHKIADFLQQPSLGDAVQGPYPEMSITSFPRLLERIDLQAWFEQHSDSLGSTA